MEWQTDLAAVERIYVTDWLLKGIFDSAPAKVLVLRGASALRYAHSSDYAIADAPEFWSALADETALRDMLVQATRAAAKASGLSYSLDRLTRNSAQVEYGGPLGRRSAAQPHITLSFLLGQPRLAPEHRSLIHLFSDKCAATVSAVTLDELVAERVASLAAQPRARDVYDLWFAATQVRGPIDWARVRALAADLAQRKQLPLPRREALFEPAHRAVLDRAWEGALRQARGHPPLAQVEQDLRQALEPVFQGPFAGS